jgi:hypothetical protein
MDQCGISVNHTCADLNPCIGFTQDIMIYGKSARS